MPRRKTQAEFLQQAKAKHGDRYDYSQSLYVSSNKKVTVICPQHGKFQVAPGHHINGVGCRRCYFDSQRHDLETILSKFREVHSDRYSYDRVKYRGLGTKVVITCPIHGDFKQDPSAHINGSGCTKCFNERQTQTTAEFIARAKEVHGSRYDYSRVEYVNRKHKVTIICRVHGLFKQHPGNHLRGNNCPKCNFENLPKSKRNHHFEDKGVSYYSIKHACKKLKLNYWRVLKRLDAGWKMEQAFEEEERLPRHCFYVNGKVYNGYEDAVRQLNTPVSSATVRRRLRNGMTPEEAVFTPPKFSYSNGAIYLVTNKVNDKQYVGLTTTSLEERWKRHLEQASSKNRSLLHKAIAQHGQDSFTIEVIDRADSIKKLCKKEREWIKKLNTRHPSGYNITAGGEVGGAPGKPTRLPHDRTLYPTVQAAAEALARRKNISVAAAEKRIYEGRV